MKRWRRTFGKTPYIAWWIIIFGLVGVFIWFCLSHAAPVATVAEPRTTQEYAGGPIPSESVVTASTYKGNGIQFHIPKNLQVEFDSFWPAEQSFEVAIAATAGDSVYINGERFPGMMCFQDLCDRPAKSQKVINGVTWDYLGPTQYCDAGECPPLGETYRASQGNLRVYVQFYGSVAIDSWLEGFSFTE